MQAQADMSTVEWQRQRWHFPLQGGSSDDPYTGSLYDQVLFAVCAAFAVPCGYTRVCTRAHTHAHPTHVMYALSLHLAQSHVFRVSVRVRECWH